MVIKRNNFRGIGSSYVLANKNEDEVYQPFAVPKEFFKNKVVDQVFLISKL